MDHVTKRFFDRIKAGISPDRMSLCKFITEETYLNLERFSFLGHEYQKYFVEMIEKDLGVDLTVEKCSQIGLSQISFHYVLAQMALVPGFAVLYAMPSKIFAQEVLKTRISPIITGSPALKELISKDVDSASVKMFKNGSILYALGASGQSSSSLINRPIRLVFVDELDKCDYDTVTGFRSRQTHSKWKPRIMISTPTAPGIGINGESENRELHQQWVKCDGAGCGHEFLPSYYDHVRLKGWESKSLLELTVDVVREKGLNLDDSWLFCPECGKRLDLKREVKRFWVIENKGLEKKHLRLTPFDAPDFISCGDLIKSQLTYSSEAEFRNQALGLPASQKDSTIDIGRLTWIRKGEAGDGIRVGSIDLGRTSWYLGGVLKNDGRLIVTEARTVELGELREWVPSKIKRDNLAGLVSDAMPFLDLVVYWTGVDGRFWSAIYRDPVNVEVELYKVKVKGDTGDGLGEIRRVQIQKNLFFDHMAGLMMDSGIIFEDGPWRQTMIEHFTDMRRIRDHRYSEVRYRWVKSRKGVDHWWHSLCYLCVCAKMVRGGILGGGNGLGIGMRNGLVRSMKGVGEVV